MSNATNKWMQLAIEQARLAAIADEVPVGALIVQSGAIVGVGFNRVEENHNPIHHAELLAIQQACQTLRSTHLVDCDIYVTLEPCPMCAQAISTSRIRRLYFGAMDIKSGGVISGPQIYSWSSAHHKPEVYSGIMEYECSTLLKEFFHNKRI